MEFAFFGFVILFFILIITAIAYSIISAGRRTEALLLAASRKGFEFSRSDCFGIPNMYSYLDSLSKGHSRKAYNVMYGRLDEYESKAFDYTYQTGSGKSQTTHHLSVVLLDTDVCFTPLYIRPENFGDRIAGAIGFDDIDFESDEFSRAFYVKSTDKKFAYDVIHQRMMDFLIDNRGWSIQMHGRSIMVCNGRLFSPEEFDKAMDFVTDFLKRLPDYLWQKLRSS